MACSLHDMHEVLIYISVRVIRLIKKLTQLIVLFMHTNLLSIRIFEGHISTKIVE